MASSSIIPQDEGGLFAVPEDCVAAIIAFTTPTDACRLALVSRGFQSASESDIIWERFLPSDCDLIISRSDSGEALLAEFRKKKRLYMRLASQPLLVDRASKSFWLEKSSGKKCWMISARSLSITWGDTPIYWKWTSIPESRFPEVAQLLRVCWFDVGVRIQTSMLSPGTQYAAYLVFNMTENAYGFEDTFEASVRSTAGGIITHRVYVDVTHQQESSTELIPNTRTDGWKELKIGEFFAHAGEEDDEVELAVREVEVLYWKRGLIVQGIEVRPA